MSSSTTRYGVIFSQGKYFLEDHIEKMTPKTLNVAIKQVLQFEEHFSGQGHIIDLETNEEVLFDRVYPYHIRGSVLASRKPCPAYMNN